MNDVKKELFDECYRQFSKDIFRYIFFKVNDVELAKDFTSDTFIRFWKALAKRKDIRNSRALVYKMAHGIVVDHYRRKQLRKTVSLEMVDEFELVNSDDFEAKFSIKQQSEHLLELLKYLKKEYSEVLLLYYVDELNIFEISKIINKKENTVRVLIHRATKSLKEKYETTKRN